MNNPASRVMLFIALITLNSSLFAQTVGIGVDLPTATLDIRSTTGITSLNVNRTLAVSANMTPAVVILDQSNYATMEVYHAGLFNPEEAVFISNAGLNNALWANSAFNGNSTATARFTTAGSPNGNALDVQNTVAGNVSEVAYVLHSGAGIGMLVELSSLTNASDGIQVTHEGLGDGLYVLINNTASTQQAVDITHFGTGHGIRVDMPNSPSSGANYGMLINDYQNNQVGIYVNNDSVSAWGMINILWDGVGIYNDFKEDDGVSVFTDMQNVDGAGYFFTNVDLSSLPGSVVGSGDGFALDVFMNTTTASAGSIVSGAAIGADQYGTGHGALINHNGTAGRNVEFNVTNSSNTDPAIFSVNEGQGSVIIGQQQNNAIGSAVSVADFSYTGTEALDHVGVTGSSNPAVGSGIGGYFSGGKYGVVGNGGSLSAVHAIGNMSATGTKPFMIDHPLDPENKMLRHFAVESDEVLNMYRGIVRIGRGGKAFVQLPEYFESINVNYSYQLTAIGTPRQPWVVEEISNNRFIIGGKPGTKVSWTVHANRNDAFVRANPDMVTTEVIKSPRDKGKYLDPLSHGQPLSIGSVQNLSVVQAPMHRQVPKTAAEVARRSDQLIAPKALNPDQAVKKHQTYNPAKPGPIPNTDERQQFQPMKIKQEIRTWDELH